MRFQLVPGLLSEQRIECDDDHHKLVVNLHLVPLSATQYQLVAALLRQRKHWEEDTQDHVPLIVTVAELQRVAGLRRRRDVKKHLCYASSRLASQDLRVASVHGYGYAIFHLSELQPAVPTPAASATVGRPSITARAANFREAGTNVPKN